MMMSAFCCPRYLHAQVTKTATKAVKKNNKKIKNSQKELYRISNKYTNSKYIGLAWELEIISHTLSDAPLTNPLV